MIYTYDNRNLQFKKISIIYPILVIGVIFGSLGFTGAVKFNNFIERIPVIIKEKEEVLTKEYVKTLLEDCKIQNKDIVLQQILLESGNFTSPVCKQGKNITGMKKCFSRQNCQSGEFLNHSRYNSYRDCIVDYALFQANYCNNLTQEEYYSFLQQFYSETNDYVSRLKNMK